jgi:predicted RNA-binding Zn-ribbon protein involved in translation (DUF1610 family)
MSTAQPISEEQRQASARRTVLARWRCPDCGVSAAGYIEPFDYAPRRCRGVPASGKTGSSHFGVPICGAVMVQMARIEPQSTNYARA